MCLLFLYVCDTAAEDGYRLILANNRDEFWNRPTKLANVWGSNAQFISGLDLEPGREGGTWLAVSKAGTVGVLLNILGILDKTMRGRGKLVTNFLEGDLGTDEYITHKILPIQQEFNKFNLILVDLSAENATVTYYNNKTNTTESLRNGVYGFDNSILAEPWQKSVHGRAAFARAVEDHGRKTDRDQLVQSMFTILSDRTQFHDDMQLLKQASMSNTSDRVRHERSAALVWSPTVGYGTRTQTVVLVDRYGECEYIERTFSTPVDPENLNCQTKSYKFQITPHHKL